MAYRDEVESLRARVERLQSELDATREELARHRHRELAASRKVHPLIGSPTELSYERDLDGELGEVGLEQLVSELRGELGELGRTETIGGTLAWSSSGRDNRVIEVTCEVRAGRTRIRVKESMRHLVGGMFGGVVGGVGGGGLGVVLLPAMRLGWGFVPVACIAWLLVIYLLVRTLFAKKVARRAAQLQQLIENLHEQAARRLAADAKLRIDSEDDAAEAEHLAEQEAQEARAEASR